MTTQLEKLLAQQPTKAAEATENDPLVQRDPFGQLTDDNKIKKAKRRYRLKLGLGILLGGALIAIAGALAGSVIGLPVAGFIGVCGGAVLGASLLDYRTNKTRARIYALEHGAQHPRRRSRIRALFPQRKYKKRIEDQNKALEAERKKPENRAYDWDEPGIEMESFDNGNYSEEQNDKNRLTECLLLMQNNTHLTVEMLEDLQKSLMRLKYYPKLIEECMADFSEGGLPPVVFEIIKDATGPDCLSRIFGPVKKCLLQILLENENEENLLAFHNSLQELTDEELQTCHAFMSSLEGKTTWKNDLVMGLIEAKINKKEIVTPNLTIKPLKLDPIPAPQPLKEILVGSLTEERKDESMIEQATAASLSQICMAIVKHGENDDLIRNLYETIQCSTTDEVQSCLKNMEDMIAKTHYPKSVFLLQEALEGGIPAVLVQLNKLRMNIEALSAEDLSNFSQEQLEAHYQNIQTIMHKTTLLNEELAKPENISYIRLAETIKGKCTHLAVKTEGMLRSLPSHTPSPSEHHD